MWETQHECVCVLECVWRPPELRWKRVSGKLLPIPFYCCPGAGACVHNTAMFWWVVGWSGLQAKGSKMASQNSVYDFRLLFFAPPSPWGQLLPTKPVWGKADGGSFYGNMDVNRGRHLISLEIGLGNIPLKSNARLACVYFLFPVWHLIKVLDMARVRSTWTRKNTVKSAYIVGISMFLGSIFSIIPFQIATWGWSCYLPRYILAFCICLPFPPLLV